MTVIRPEKLTDNERELYLELIRSRDENELLDAENERLSNLVDELRETLEQLRKAG